MSMQQIRKDQKRIAQLHQVLELCGYNGTICDRAVEVKLGNVIIFKPINTDTLYCMSELVVEVEEWLCEDQDCQTIQQIINIQSNKED